MLFPIYYTSAHHSMLAGWLAGWFGSREKRSLQKLALWSSQTGFGFPFKSMLNRRRHIHFQQDLSLWRDILALFLHSKIIQNAPFNTKIIDFHKQ